MRQQITSVVEATYEGPTWPDLSPFAWTFVGLTMAFLIYIGATLAVALISTGPRGERAQAILGQLLGVVLSLVDAIVQIFRGRS